MPHLHKMMRRLNKNQKKEILPTCMEPDFYSMPSLLSVSPADSSRGRSSHSQQRPLLTHDHQDGVNGHCLSIAFTNGVQSQISSISSDNSCTSNSTDALLAAAMPLRANGNIKNNRIIGSSLQPAQPSTLYSGCVSPLPNSGSMNVMQSLPSSEQKLLELLLQCVQSQQHQRQEQQLQQQRQEQILQLRQIQSMTSPDFNTNRLLQNHIMNSGVCNHATSSMNNNQQEMGAGRSQRPPPSWSGNTFLQNLNDALSANRYTRNLAQSDNGTNNGAHNGNHAMNHNGTYSQQS